jgi:holin-like protein
MLQAITLLLLFQLVGEVIAQTLDLPVPGPVVGMGLFFAVLALPRGPAERMREPAQQLLQHLSLLFVPAGVGVMLHYHRVIAEWLPIVVALVLSTVLAIVVTAVTTRWLARLLNITEETEHGR